VFAKKKIYLRGSKKISRFFPSQKIIAKRELTLSQHEFLIHDENKICYYTFHPFHLSQYAKQIMLPTFISSHPSLLLSLTTHMSNVQPFEAHDDENIKKIARKIQIHNAKRYVMFR
jgi:hypothetical protein